MISSIIGTARALIRSPSPAMVIQTRTKMKTHKAAAKRFIKVGNGGLKRKQAGRNHGNGGFSANSVRHLDSFVKVSNKGGHLKKLKAFL